MPRFIRKMSKKSGLPPGTLVHIGEGKTEKVKITIIDYNESHFQEKEAKTIEECFSFKDTPTVTWINIDGVHQLDIIEKIGSRFGFHSLLLEDIVDTSQRPKMEDFVDDMLKLFRSNKLDKDIPDMKKYSWQELAKQYALYFYEILGE